MLPAIGSRKQMNKLGIRGAVPQVQKGMDDLGIRGGICPEPLDGKFVFCGIQYQVDQKLSFLVGVSGMNHVIIFPGV